MIVGFWCQNCSEVVDEAHYAPWSPCESGITPGHIRNILTHAEGRPATGWSVTQIKSCLRSTVIERTENCIVDPADYLKMDLGSAWDAWITRSQGPKVRWHGKLGDLAISGEPDGWKHIHTIDSTGDVYDTERPYVIWDFKNGTPPRSGVWPDHRWQVSMYAMLSPYAFDHGYIFYNSYSGKAGKVAKRRFDLISSEDELLNYRLYKGYTVRDNVKLAIGHTRARAAAYPLTGQSIPMGKKTLCSYCVVRDRCDELEGNAGI